MLLFVATGCEVGWPLAEIECERELFAADAEQLTGLLSEAVPGDCIVAEKGEYAGSFTIPTGVAVSGRERNPPLFIGEKAGETALILMGGETSLVAHVQIDTPEGHGLMVVGGPARVLNSDLSAPKGLALTLRCATEGCNGNRIDVIGNEIHDSLNGILVHGVVARLDDNDLHDFDGVSIQAGIALAIGGDAAIDASRNRVTGAGEAAVLLDGGGTTAAFTDLSVIDNRGRGLWAQGLQGTRELPALTIGGASEFVRNTIVGIGSTDAVGIVMDTCIVRDTVAVEAVTGLGTAKVGDGLGLFGFSSEVTIGAGVTFSGNERAALLVDSGGTGIVIGNAIVEPGAGGFGIVIQRTTNSVELAAGMSADDPGEVLGVVAGPVGVPGG